MYNNRMFFLSLIVPMVIYIFILSWKLWKSIREFEQNARSHIPVVGKIESISEIKRGDGIETAYPVYACSLDDGQTIKNMGLIRYSTKTLVIGTEINLVYDGKTGKLWNEAEIIKTKRRTWIINIIVIIGTVLVILF